MPNPLSIGVVICSNLDGWHDSLFTAYLILPDRIIDEPSDSRVDAILARWKMPFIYVPHTCIHCKRRLNANR
jgi:hypothetical protein